MVKNDEKWQRNLSFFGWAVVQLVQCTQLCICETGHTLDTCFKEHLAGIKHQRDKPVANHFNQTGHTIHTIDINLIKGLWLLFTLLQTEKTWNHTWLINSAAGNQAEWMKDYNHTWLSFGECLFRPYMAVNMLLNFPPFPPTPSDAFTVAYHSTALVHIYTCTIVWECMCASLSLSHQD